MSKIKLSEYCEQNGISYITGYRWFKKGTLPVPAIQTESGTILVDDGQSITKSDPQAINLLINKTVEFSKNNSSLQDLAGYVLSNFSLQINTLDSNTNICSNVAVNSLGNYIQVTGDISSVNCLYTANLVETPIETNLISKNDDIEGNKDTTKE